MMVRELMDILKKCEGSRIVTIASDLEGNSYSKLDEVTNDIFIEEGSGRGMSCSEKDAKDEGWCGEQCITLWPM